VSGGTAVVSFTQLGPIGFVEINNPPVNTINRAVRIELSEALVRAKGDANVKVLLIATAGPVFMAGADITGFAGSASGPTLQALEMAIETGSMPIVVAIQGLALGGGLELAMSSRASTVRSRVGARSGSRHRVSESPIHPVCPIAPSLTIASPTSNWMKGQSC
jgi:enoyl-CoA hydratase/carnithine racemase